MKPLLGIMQGRLSAPTGGRIQCYPKLTWREEFEKARLCELDLIEWIFEEDEWQTNSLASDSGIAEIRRISKETGVGVQSVCADYFMDSPLVRTNQDGRARSIDMLKFIIEQCAKLGVKYIGVPFVDKSAILTEEDRDDVLTCISACLPTAKTKNISLALETSLGPQEFSLLLRDFNHSHVGVNYDIGNSASLGFDTEEEISSYGDKIFSVHIKDRVLNGTTVALGTGNANFEKTFQALANANFSGPFIFQTARLGNEIENAHQNIRYITPFLSKYFLKR